MHSPNVYSALFLFMVYFTFPVALLRGGFSNIKTVVNNAMLYSGYAIAVKLEHGTDAEKMKAAGNKLSMTYGSPSQAFKAGKDLYEQFSGTPMTSVSHEIVFQYYKEEKTDFQIACFLAFAATRSIIQTKPYCKTNKAHIHARMVGYASINDVPEFLSEVEMKYAKRWHMDNVLKELQLGWGLKTFSDHSRGLYMGFDVSLEKLAEVNLLAKKKTKENVLKELKRAALNKAKAKLASNQ